MGYLKNIDRQPKRATLGGIITIDVARKAEVESIPAPVNGIVNGPVVLKAGGSFYRWVAQQQKTSYNADAKPTREGPSKSIELNFFIPLDREVYRQMLETAERDEFIVVVTYPTGKKKIFGQLHAPVLFQFNHKSGQSPSDSNGNNCRFYFEGPNNIFFYNSTVSSSPGTAPCPVYWNGVVIASLLPGESIHFESEFGYTDFFIIT